MPRSTVMAGGGGGYINISTSLDQTFMDFIGTKFQEKQKHVLLCLELWMTGT